MGDLRDQVNMLRSGQPQGEEAMSAILRDKINELLTENANLEREVARLREAERTCRDTAAAAAAATENTPADIIATDTDIVEVSVTEASSTNHSPVEVRDTNHDDITQKQKKKYLHHEDDENKASRKKYE